MEISQMRDGRWTVYRAGDWIGTADQLPSGTWIFVPRDVEPCGLGLTIAGAVEDADRKRGKE